MNLLGVNLLFAAFSMSLAIIFTALPNWYPGWHACAVYHYMILPLSSCQLWSQTLVTVIRIWAVFHPFSYRTIHSYRIAVATCSTVWVTTHLVGLPIFILDAVWYRTPAPYHCTLFQHVQPVTTVVFELIMIDLTVVVLLVAYPLLFWKLWRRMRKRAKTSMPKRMDVNAVVRTDNSGPVETSEGSSAARLMRERNESCKAIFMLSMMTVSTSVFYAPFLSLVSAQPWIVDTIPTISHVVPNHVHHVSYQVATRPCFLHYWIRKSAGQSEKNH
ncbi:uncharacterized protein LOC129595686 [Paramacrobiotus metropolitanus]|uniref:uncharacterized protein LOC129595686 n=1 Tax=Paramacrobiotus metropolitanus TaxID=2943436 RepID=UPI00244604D5|nr:uncharacterized protein LOC129595686 [Paramacrobiotus metropolitanus]